MDRTLRTGVLVLISTLAVVGSCRRGGGDDDPVFPPNQGPVIATLASDPASVVAGQSALLSVVASDPDGDPLSYAWSATAGSILGSGFSVTWVAPAQPGSAVITVAVSDGSLADQAELAITVASPNSWLTGSWSLVGFEHDPGSGLHVAVTGTVDFDGAGSYAASFTINADGAIEIQSPSSTYAVTSTGSLTMDDGSGGLLQGGLDSTHEIGIVSRSSSAGNPLIVILVRRSGTYVQATLSGDYHVAALHWDWGFTPAYAAFTGVGTFDAAAGAFSFTATNNWGGTVYQVGADLGYAVAADGTATLTDPVNSQVEFSGGILTGGHVLVASAVAPGSKPMMLVALRKSGAFTAGALGGPHRTVSFGPSAAGASGWVGERTFDGVSAWTAAGMLNDGGVLVETQTSGSYSITSDGRLTLAAPPMEFQLGVREEGKAAAGAVISPGNAPRFVFSVRK